MNFTNSIKICLKEKYANFSGRASRSEFWFFYLFMVIVYIIGFIITFYISFKLLWLMVIFILAMIIPAFAVTARRLHDINKSGWFQILPFPAAILEAVFATTSENLETLFLIIGLGLYIYLFILYCSNGDKKVNKYGKNIYKKTKKKTKRSR